MRAAQKRPTRPSIKTPGELAAFKYGVQLAAEAAAEKFSAVISRIERKLDNLEGAVRFSTRHTNFKRSTGRRL